MLDNHFASFDKEYKGLSAAGSKNRRVSHVLGCVHFAQIDEAHAMIFFKRM